MPRPKPTTEPLTLSRWHVKRSGGSMTAYGIDIATGEETRVANIERLDPPASAAEHYVLATAKNGVAHKLTFAL